MTKSIQKAVLPIIMNVKNKDTQWQEKDRK